MKIGVNGAIDNGVRMLMNTNIAWLIITTAFHVGLQFYNRVVRLPLYLPKDWVSYQRIILNFTWLRKQTYLVLISFVNKEDFCPWHKARACFY
jgi:hypothetical protein